MELCDGGRRHHHDDVVHDGTCPVCEALEQVDELKEQLQNVQIELNSAEAHIRELEAERAACGRDLAQTVQRIRDAGGAT